MTRRHLARSLTLSLLFVSFRSEASVGSRHLRMKDARNEFPCEFPRSEECRSAARWSPVGDALDRQCTQEPRFQITGDASTQLVFGINVDALKPGEAAVVDRAALGYPIKSLAGVPAGEYWVQALLHKYETFHLKNGHTVKLPMDRGEGQQWNKAPGNLFSTPKKIHIDPQHGVVENLLLDQEISPIEPPKDTKYIKHIKIRSKLLTEFWGRPMHLGACVLLPHGFEEHPKARYPLAIFHGHFPATIGGFRETPPDPNLGRSLWAGSSCTATTNSRKSTRISFTRIGPGPASRGW